jgi:hypothetical protein
LTTRVVPPAKIIPTMTLGHLLAPFFTLFLAPLRALLPLLPPDLAAAQALRLIRLRLFE